VWTHFSHLQNGNNSRTYIRLAAVCNIKHIAYLELTKVSVTVKLCAI
jgi:hypothetical protein